MIDRLLALGRRLQTRLILARYRTIRQAGHDLHIGKGSQFWAPDGISIGHGVYIGKDVHCACNAEIGDQVLIANRVALIGRHDHDFRKLGMPVRFSPWIGSKNPPSPYRKEKAVIESDVWIGFGAIVLSGTRIGRGAVIAAGALVARDVPPYAIVAGNPGRIVGQRFPEEDIPLHEARIKDGHFVFSERGYEHWVVQPAHDVEPNESKRVGT